MRKPVSSASGGVDLGNRNPAFGFSIPGVKELNGSQFKKRIVSCFVKETIPCYCFGWQCQKQLLEEVWNASRTIQEISSWEVNVQFRSLNLTTQVVRWDGDIETSWVEMTSFEIQEESKVEGRGCMWKESRMLSSGTCPIDRYITLGSPKTRVVSRQLGNWNERQSIREEARRNNLLCYRCR